MVVWVVLKMNWRKNMDSANLLLLKNMRKQFVNEVIFDIDDRSETGLECYMETAIALVNAGYHIEVWYAVGMKNPHIHIKNIPHIDQLSRKEGTQYRKLMFEKYIPKRFWNEKIPDYSIANPYEDGYHPISEENKPHYKYGTLVTLRSEFNPNKLNFCEKDLFNQVKIITPSTYKLSDYSGDLLYRKIAAKISILVIADQFGLKPIGKQLRVCPFHADSSPSLSLNQDLGLFHCFGCNVSGNIIKFYDMLKDIRKDFKLEVYQNDI